MDPQPPNKDNKETESGCLAPLLYLGSPIAIFGVAKLLSENDQALGNGFLVVGLIIWFLSPLLLSIPGKNLKETKNNFMGLMYLAGLTVVVLVVLGVVSLVLPSSCVRDDTPAPADIYYRR